MEFNMVSANLKSVFIGFTLSFQRGFQGFSTGFNWFSMGFCLVLSGFSTGFSGFSADLNRFQRYSVGFQWVFTGFSMGILKETFDLHSFRFSLLAIIPRPWISRGRAPSQTKKPNEPAETPKHERYRHGP